MTRSLVVFLLVALSAARPAPAGAETVRVLAWNLMDMDLYDGDGSGRVARQVEAESEIARVIRGVDADIVFIAEAPSLVELESFVAAHGLAYRVVHVRQQSGRRDYADAMALLTREAPSRSELTTPPVPGSDTPERLRYRDWSYRGLLSAEVGGLSVVGVHLKSPWDGELRSYRIRDGQVGGLLAYVQGSDGPTVILGDFNDSPGTDAAEEEFRIPDSIGRLDSAFERAAGDEITQKSGLNLDHIFVRGAAVGPRNIVETDWSLSDHRPVWADIEY